MLLIFYVCLSEHFFVLGKQAYFSLASTIGESFKASVQASFTTFSRLKLS
ncbi:hypothetical protein SynSYN20_01320 [Synechococcus sp. SYN20]|nr:hypothetical protein [Synechococcus sp. SYN20]QNJ25654.1 hypothetical protein SynSYN20_01320 [Synechococcus sp. SYN20]